MCKQHIRTIEYRILRDDIMEQRFEHPTGPQYRQENRNIRNAIMEQHFEHSIGPEFRQEEQHLTRISSTEPNSDRKTNQVLQTLLKWSALDAWEPVDPLVWGLSWLSMGF